MRGAIYLAITDVLIRYDMGITAEELKEIIHEIVNEIIDRGCCLC